MKRPYVYLLFVLVLTAGIQQVKTCSCFPMTLEEQFSNANVVFVGKVLSQNAAGQYTVENTIEVGTVWKGTLGQTTIVSTATNSAACGFNFTIGEHYLIYGYTNEGGLSTNLCSRTTLLSNSCSPDLIALSKA